MLFRSEVARFAGCTPKRVREIADELSLRALAIELHARLVRPDGETPLEWMRGTLISAAWAHCAAGRCTHAICERQRAQEAAQRAARPSARPTHETRHREAHSASNRSRGDASLDKSRGAPGPRNPGGASARSTVPRA